MKCNKEKLLRMDSFNFVLLSHVYTYIILLFFWLFWCKFSFSRVIAIETMLSNYLTMLLNNYFRGFFRWYSINHMFQTKTQMKWTRLALLISISYGHEMPSENYQVEYETPIESETTYSFTWIWNDLLIHATAVSASLF